MARPDATEKATPKRKREARERGQVPRSQDIGGSAIFLAVVIALHAGFMGAVGAGAQAFTVALQHAGSRDELTIRSVGGLFIAAVMPYTPLLAMAFLSAVVLAVVANVLQFGLLFSPQLLAPQTLVQFAKQVMKLAIVILICWLGVKDNLTLLYALAHASPHDIIVSIEGIVFWIGVKVGALLLIVGLADYIWERRRLEQSLHITKKKKKDEKKKTEGKPRAKH